MEDPLVFCGVALILVWVIYIGFRVRDLLRAVRESRSPETAPNEGPSGEQIARMIHDESTALLEEVGRRLDDLSGRVEEVARMARGFLDSEPGDSVSVEVEPMLREAVERLDARLDELASAVVERRVETLGQTVSRVLSEKGFVDVSVLGEPATEGDRTQVLVTARRDGMTYKGSVHLEGAKVVVRR
jgi:hypothetical protein